MEKGMTEVFISCGCTVHDCKLIFQSITHFVTSKTF